MSNLNSVKQAKRRETETDRERERARKRESYRVNKKSAKHMFFPSGEGGGLVATVTQTTFLSYQRDGLPFHDHKQGTGMNEILYELLTRRKRISTSWT